VTTTSQALAQRDTHPAAQLQQQYAARLAALVPSHVNGEAWVRQATGTLRNDDLAAAARSDFGSFVSAVERAAVLGLRPGSEEFYLVPRKQKGRLQVLGIIGWQGLVELCYRSGAVASVVAEVVHAADRFAYRPGRDAIPDHEVDWDAEDRGPLRLVYAFARMTDGSVSKVVVLNRADIDRIKQSSDGASSPYSPWQKHEAAMWLKSAVRQLAKWVPTSVERVAQQAKAQAIATQAAARAADLPAAVQAPAPMPALPAANPVTGELLDDPADRVADESGEAGWPAQDDTEVDPTTEPGWPGGAE
jgi:recombination protein RecT